MSDLKQYPQIGKTYRHYKGGRYTPITLAIEEDSLKELIIYKSNEFGTVYARPLREWYEEVENSFGMLVYRFEEWNGI